MPTGLYRQTCRGRTRNRPIEGINCKKIESTGKPDFSLVYATRMEFLRTTAGTDDQNFMDLSARQEHEADSLAKSQTSMATAP